MTEKEKRDLGEYYDAVNDQELILERLYVKNLCYDYNMIRPSDTEKKTEVIKKILGNLNMILVLV